MNRELVAGMVISVAVHGACFLVGGRSISPAFDVQRDVSSLEVELMAVEQVVAMERLAPTPAAQEPEAWAKIEPARPEAMPSTMTGGEGALTEAKPLASHNPPPRYPILARMMGWQGLVVLEVTVEPTGRASDVHVIQTSSYQVLDQAAQQAVHEWAFVPASQSGQSVRSQAQIPIRFQLKEASR